MHIFNEKYIKCCANSDSIIFFQDRLVVANTKVLRKSYETKCLKFYIVTSFLGGGSTQIRQKTASILFSWKKDISATW